MGKGWRERGLVFMVTAFILAIVVVLVLAFAAQRLMDNEGTITPTTTHTAAK